MGAKGIYIYGIVPNFYGTTQFQSLENSGVYAITFQNISAVVSDRDSVYLDYLDRESLGHLLVHHQKTIEELQGKGFTMIIPMQLGTIAGSKEEVLQSLACGYETIIDTLKKIEYLTEIDLAVTWADFGATIKEIAGHPEIMALKEEILGSGDKLSQVDQVKIGMLVQEKLDNKNKTIEINILDALSPFGIDIKLHPVMNDQMVTNSAFLITRARQDKFEKAVIKLDEEYDGMLNFKLVGPLPCYSFYTLEVKKLDPLRVEAARKELGVKEKTTEGEIKKAYLEKAKVFHPDNSLLSDETENFNRIRKAYQALQEFSAAVRQSSREEYISFTNENVMKNLILIKIKE
ncbi:MAG: GvpL/GvpF family gas vesicle protein [Bacteroidota bacterium]